MQRVSLLKTARQISKKIFNVTTATVIGLSSLAATAPLFLTQTAYAAGNTLYVATTGTDSSNCQTLSTPCQTITYAVSQAITGDTISVASGPYAEVVSISKDLTLLGAQPGVAGNSHSGTESTVTGFNITNANVTIDGFDIVPGTSNSGAGIVFNGGTSEIVQNNVISGYNSEGMALFGTSGMVFQNNLLTNPILGSVNVDGIFAGSGVSNTTQILNNVFSQASFNSGTDIGLSYTSGTNPVISGNVSTNGATLVTLFNSTGGQITNNTFASNSDLSAVGIYIGGGDNNTTVSGNTVTGAYYGVGLRNYYSDGPNVSTTITGNTLTGNYGGGISAASGSIGSSEIVTAHQNDLSGNPVGVNNASAGTINAKNNYWGTADASIVASEISGSNVTYSPYYVDSGLTHLNTDTPTQVYVDGTYAEGNSGSHSFGWDAFTTIQAAIDAVANSGTVTVNSGTYNENLVVNKSVDLEGTNATINGGDGFAITLESPNVTINGFTIAANSDGEGIYNIDASTPSHDISGVTITNNVFSGSSRAIALESNATGTVKVNDNQFDSNDKDLAVADNSFGDLQIEGNTFNEPTTNDTGVQIGPDGTGTISSFEFETNQVHGNVNIGANVNGATVSGNQFNAGSVSGGDVEFQAALHSGSTITNNTFDGGQTYACLQLFGSQYSLPDPSNGVTISGNTLNNCGDTSSPYNYGFQLSQDVSNVTFTDNTIDNAYDSVSTRTGTGWTLNSNIHINDNTITNSRHLAINNTVTGTLDTSSNWWGNALGPDSTQFSGNVNVSPWCSVADCSATQSESSGTTTLPNDQSVIVSSSPVLNGDSVTLPGVNNVTMSTSTSAGTVSVTIPAGTSITANGGTWNGTLNPPAVVSYNVPGTTNTALAISVGSSNSTLTFDNGVRLVLPGQAGKHVGFIEPGGSFTEITTTCSGDSQTVGDALATGGACKINVGGDLVVWTKHFTIFATYSQAQTATAVQTIQAATKSNTYVVQPSDTMSGIAQKLGLTLAELEALNPQAGHPAGNFDLILPGDVLKVGGAVVTASASSAISSAAGTPVPSSNNSSGQVLGTHTSNPTPKAQQVATTTTKKSSNKFLGLGWWWIPILLIVAAVIYYVHRAANTNEQSTGSGKK